ncbi:MarR family winged helix-turn-helix transcriptional regulator [Saxibacter everestensis]|uniref:MarR family winged helix-turn-helix transcriptional regulator n=1 Tax=Saxibacter everestensis TaxID=2909229 RepID=UPI0032E35C77
MHHILDLQRTLRSVNAARLSDLGVALEGVLRYVGEGGESRASAVAARLGVGAPALSRQIADLEERGLVVRRPDPADGRAHLLSLSETGRGYLAEVERRRAETIQELLAGWSESEVSAAATSIEHLSAALRAALETGVK